MAPRASSVEPASRQAIITLAAINVILVIALIIEAFPRLELLVQRSPRWDVQYNPAHRSPYFPDADVSAAAHKDDCPPMNITVVYNVYIWPKQDWKFLIGSQLRDLAETGLHQCAQVVIAVAIPEKHKNYTYLELQDLLQLSLSFIREHEAGSQAVVIQEHENAYEYPGIHSLYRIANSEADDALAHNHVFLYFHTKGMVNYGVLTRRIDQNVFDGTIVPWRGVVQQFLLDDDIRAAAWLPSTGGWGWYNFWWVRGDFVKKLKEPRRSVKRHWFESWLGSAKPEDKAGTKVFSSCHCDVVKGFYPKELKEVKKKCKPATKDTCLSTY